MTANPFWKVQRGAFFGTAAFFLFALTFGGLGPHAPLFNGLIESAAFPLLVAVALFGRAQEWARLDQGIAALFILALLAVGVCQLIPIAPDAWRSLPGRETPSVVLETLGVADRARPLSLAPEDTRLVIQSWLPPISIFFATMVATRDERARLTWLVILSAAISCGFGLLQLSFGDGSFFLEPADIPGRYPGLFANYNQQAVFLAAAVALIPAVWSGARQRSDVWGWWPMAFWGLALIGTLITSSRAGLALFGLSSLVTATRLLPTRRPAAPRDPRRLIAAILVFGVALGFAGWLASGGYRAELIGSRFETVSDDARFEFWSTTLEAIRAFFPYGAGFGTFEPVYQLTEPLEHVRNYVVNHAHNDYLELVLEAGAGGILLLVLFVIWFGTRLVSLVRERRGRDSLAWSGATIVILVMLHSLVEYPLRTETIGCLFAFACALLLPPPGEPRSQSRTSAPPTPGIAA